jgi:hypothetical protein
MYDQIDPAIFERYNVAKEDIQELYNSHRLYSRILQCSRNAKADKEAIRIKNKAKYYCELCDKDVRCCIRYHHEKTQKHVNAANQNSI